MNVPKISLSTAAKSDGWVLAFFHADGEKSKPALKFVGKSSREIDALLGLLRKSGHFSAKKNETNVLRFFQFGGMGNTVLLGLGSQKKWTRDVARQAGAALRVAQKKERFSKLSVQSDGLFAKEGGADLEASVQAFCEGYWLGGYEFRDLKKADPEIFEPEGIEIVGLKQASLAKAVERAQIVAQGVLFARGLGDRPGNLLTPTEFARLTEKMGKERKLKVSVLGRKELDTEKMGLLVGVGRGSSEEPKLIVIEHRGGKKTDKPIALVGKGITFDSGGISIKPSARMEEMKYDMMGAAAVAGIMQAVSDLNLPLNVAGFIAAAENLPGGRATKPGDVHRSMSGKTVEITNTDAEGRLVLADAIEYAQKYFQPQAILDFATLTGAVVDALGKVVSGIMGNHAELVERVRAASAFTGEKVWELPLMEEYEEDLRSPVADIRNSGIREAGASKGASFIKFFVDPKYPWVHFDIAGSAYNRTDLNYLPAKYGAGVMVRLVIHLLSHWKPLR